MHLSSATLFFSFFFALGESKRRFLGWMHARGIATSLGLMSLPGQCVFKLVTVLRKNHVPATGPARRVLRDALRLFYAISAQ